jgi:hypothetical protein
MGRRSMCAEGFEGVAHAQYLRFEIQRMQWRPLYPYTHWEFLAACLCRFMLPSFCPLDTITHSEVYAVWLSTLVIADEMSKNQNELVVN